MDYYARHQALEAAVSQLLKALAAISAGLPREEILAAALVKVQSEQRRGGKWMPVEHLRTELAPGPDQEPATVPTSSPADVAPRAVATAPGATQARGPAVRPSSRKLLPKRRAARKLVRVSKKGKKLKGKTPRPNGEAGTFSAVLISTLAKNPGISVADLAAAVYGDDDEATSKVRSLLSMLKGQGKVDNPTPGRWEVVQKKDG